MHQRQFVNRNHSVRGCNFTMNYNILSLFIALVQTKWFTMCEPFNHLIVEEINRYRDDLMCLTPVKGLNYITTNQDIVTAADDTLNNQEKIKNFHGGSITLETCDYTRDDFLPDKDNVERFIKQCTTNARNKTNTKLAWLWNPSIVQIGCKFNTTSKFVFCLLNEVNETSYTNIQFEEPNLTLNDGNKRTGLYTNHCRARKLGEDTFKSCHVNQLARNRLLEELNSMRNKIAESKNYTNINYVKWDSKLEMVAIEASNFDLDDIKFGDCFQTNIFFNKSDLINKTFTLENCTMNRYTNLLSNWITSMSENATNECNVNSASNSAQPYGWMYDAELRAIGCALTKYLKDGKVQMLCIVNRDPNRTFNLKEGQRICKTCRKPYLHLCCAMSPYAEVQHHFKFTNYDMYIGIFALILVYISIIMVFVFLRSMQHYQHQQLLFSFDG